MQASSSATSQPSESWDIQKSASTFRITVETQTDPVLVIPIPQHDMTKLVIAEDKYLSKKAFLKNLNKSINEKRKSFIADAMKSINDNVNHAHDSLQLCSVADDKPMGKGNSSVVQLNEPHAPHNLSSDAQAQLQKLAISGGNRDVCDDKMDEDDILQSDNESNN